MRSSIAALVGSRICHDLISPIGAIGNGVELLSLTDGDTTAEMRLITESVENANARIRFFRVAFGAAAEGQTVRRSEVLSILSASAIGGRFSYLWQPEDPLERRDVRAVFLAMQCLESAMPRGGDITVARDSTQWTLTATGPRVEPDVAFWRAVTQPDDQPDYTAAQVHFALLPDALSEANRSLSYEFSSERITVVF